MPSTRSIAVFAYGSLVDPASVSATLGREVGEAWPARLSGWRRRFSQGRDNRGSEKTFPRADDGSVPSIILGLNLEPAAEQSEGPNGALIAVSDAELERLDLREVRYERVEVTASTDPGPGSPGFERVVTYVAKRANLMPSPGPDAVILRSYAEAVEAAFDRLGGDHGERYRQTTLPYPVEVVDGVLIADRIPAGNPRTW